MLEAELGVGEARLAQPLDRIGHRGDLAEALGERQVVLVAQRPHHRHLVFEMKIDRGRRVLDRLGDLAHRHRVVALLDEQLARRVEDLLAQLPAFSLAAFLGTM
jgi:hypothetical protein